MFCIFCGKESQITKSNSPGVNKLKAWRRLRKPRLLNYCQSDTRIFPDMSFRIEVANATLLYNIM